MAQPGQAQGVATPDTRAASAVAARQTGGPSWSSLSAAQRAALAPLERDWHRIDEQRKQKWIEIAARYPSLPAAERQRLHERMTGWARLTPAERARARLSFQEAKQLPAPQRQARWEAYQALSAEQRRVLAERGAAKLGDRPRTVGSSTSASPVAASVPGPARAAPRPVAVKPVTPTIVQAKPGATTTPVNRIALPASHSSPNGRAKIAASPGQVDRNTLLPRVGPQSARQVPGAGHPMAQPAPAAVHSQRPATSDAASKPAGQALPTSSAQ